MGSDLPAGLLREGFALIGTVGGPLFAALFVGGLVIGVLQAATQINDPAVGFVPRLLICLGTLAVAGGWMVERLAIFVTSALQRMSEAGTWS